jgi:hypothetical protein
MNSRILTAFLASFSLLITVSSTYAKEELPQTTIEGLERVEDSKLALVYVEPGADFSQYSRIYMVDTYVAFKKNWRRDQNRSANPHKISYNDMDKMKAELAGLFRDIFTEVLEQGGYELVNERADDVLIIKPAIINLDIAAPDSLSSNDTRTYSESPGEMTLYLELFDSVTNDLIAKAIDLQTDRETGYFQWQTRVTNRAAANRILTVWANVLKDGLDKAHGVRVDSP